MRFPWIVVDGVAYPFVPVALRCGTFRLLQTLFLIDTGADTTVMPLGIAAALGLKRSRMKKTDILGLGGSTRAWERDRGTTRQALDSPSLRAIPRR